MEIKPLPSQSIIVLRRVLVGLACVLSFMVMASVFSPAQTRAGAVGRDPYPGIPPRSVEYPALKNETSSIDPHEGLQSLGSVEDRGLTVTIYATDGGPRYTVHDKSTGEELGALLSLEQVQRAFPELDLSAMEFNAGTLMLAEPFVMDWQP